MASGKVHAQAYRRGLLFSIAASLVLAGFVDPAAIWGPLGAIGGMLIDPDLSDQHNITTHTEQRMWRISPLLGYVFQVYWYPLSILIKHRAWISHWPVVGTTIRILYMFGPALSYVLVYGYGHRFDPVGWVLYVWAKREDYHWLGWTYFWWAWQDFIHFKLDGFRATTIGRKGR